MYERRLQILLDEPRYRRVAAAAKARNMSVAAVIRDAIDQAVPVDAEANRKAWRELMAHEPIEAPETVEELKEKLDDLRGRGAHLLSRTPTGW